MTCRPTSAPPARRRRTRRTGLPGPLPLTALVLASALYAGRGSVAALPSAAPIAAPSSSIPAPTVTPEPATPDGLVEPASQRNLGLPASIAVVLLVGVGSGLLRVRRSLPVERGRHASEVRRTVLR